MLQARETFDAPRPSESPMQQAAWEAYVPESRQAFAQFNTHNPNQSERMADDALDHFFKTHLECDNLYNSKKDSPAEKSIESGLTDLRQTENNLESALKKLKCGDVEGAKQDIRGALGESKDGLDFLRKGLKLHEGGGAHGAHGEDTIRDGAREVKQGRGEMRKALDLLGDGNSAEATKAVEEALRDVRLGRREASDGARFLDGRPDLQSDESKNNISFQEFDRGQRHYAESSQDLKNALKALDKNDPFAAVRDLKRASQDLNNGTNDIKDGLNLHVGKDGEKPIKGAVEKADSNSWAIDTAIDLIKRGCPEAAKQVIRDSIIRLDDARRNLGKGVEDLQPKFAQTPESKSGCGDNSSTEKPAETKTPDCATKSPGDRVTICPLKDGQKPALKPGEFLVIMIDASRDQFKDIGNFLNKLLGGSRKETGFNVGSLGATSDGGESDFSNFPKPPNPLDLVKSLPKPPSPLDLVGSLAKPLDPLGITDALPNPLDIVKNPVDVITKPLDGIKKLFKKIF